MGDIAFAITFAIGITAIVCLALLALWYRSRAKVLAFRHTRDLMEQARVSNDFFIETVRLRDVKYRMEHHLTQNGPRLGIRIVDWGPEFTGEDGTLPRWRWVVEDADFVLKECLGCERTDNPVLMLGNSLTAQEAWMAAITWVEGYQNPAEVVVLP